MTNKEVVDQTPPTRLTRIVDRAGFTLILIIGAAISLALFGLLARLIVAAWNVGYHLLP